MLDPPGQAGGGLVGPGIWETSGITDTSDLFGRGSWIFDVQAHPPTIAPGSQHVGGRTAAAAHADRDDDDDEEDDDD